MGKDKKVKWVTEKSWENFRKTGMLWFVNRVLHVFGWAIALEMDEKNKNKVIRAFPARVKYRGFDYKTEDKGFKNISNFMAKNSKRLRKECDL